MRIISALGVLLLFFSCTTTAPLESDVEPKNLGTEELVRALDIWEDFRVDEKEQLLQQSLEISPHPITYHLLAQLYLGTQRYSDATEAYTRAVTLDSSFARGFFELGLIGLWYLPNETPEIALDNLRQAFALDPSNPNYGLVLADQLRWDEDTFQEAVEVYEVLASPRQGDPMVFIAYAQFLLDIDNRSKAEEVIERARVLTELSGNLYHSGTMLIPLYRLGRVDTAEFFLSRIETSGESDYWLYTGTGVELLNHGYIDEAYRLLVKAPDIQYPLEPEHQFFLGIAEYLTRGSTNHLETFLDFDDGSLYSTVANFVVEKEGRNTDTEELFRVMVDRIERDWGPIEEKRKSILWLDRLL